MADSPLPSQITFKTLNQRFDRQLKKHWQHLHKAKALAAARRVVNNIPHLITLKQNSKARLINASYRQAAHLALMAEDKYVCLHYLNKSLSPDISYAQQQKTLIDCLIFSAHFNVSHRINSYLNKIIALRLTPQDILTKVNIRLSSLLPHQLVKMNYNRIMYSLTGSLCQRFPHYSYLINQFLKFSAYYADAANSLRTIKYHLKKTKNPEARIIAILALISKNTGVPHINNLQLQNDIIDLITKTYSLALNNRQRTFPRELMAHLIACINNTRNNMSLRIIAARLILKICCLPKTVKEVKKFFRHRLDHSGVHFIGLQLLFEQGIKKLEDPSQVFTKNGLRNKLLVLQLVCREILKSANLNLPKRRQLSIIAKRMLRRGLVQLDTNGPRLDITTRKKLLNNLQSIVRIISDEVGMKRPKIAFKALKTGDYAVYDDETNTIVVNHQEVLNSKEFKNKDQKILWLLAHELGHAYQKHHIKLHRSKHASLAANFNTYFHDHWLPHERRQYFKHIDDLYFQQPVEAHANQFAAQVLGHLDLKYKR